MATRKSSQLAEPSGLLDSLDLGIDAGGDAAAAVEVIEGRSSTFVTDVQDPGSLQVVDHRHGLVAFLGGLGVTAQARGDPSAFFRASLRSTRSGRRHPPRASAERRTRLPLLARQPVHVHRLFIEFVAVDAEDVILADVCNLEGVWHVNLPEPDAVGREYGP